jgi:hypothetical protein
VKLVRTGMAELRALRFEISAQNRADWNDYAATPRSRRICQVLSGFLGNSSSLAVEECPQQSLG